MDDEHLLVIPNENGAATVGWQYPANLHGKDIILHTLSLWLIEKKTSPAYQWLEILFRPGRDATWFNRKLLCQIETALVTIPGVNFRAKIISLDALPEWRRAQSATGRKLVVTNGCFDLLHVGHVTYLEQARNCGDELLVGVNSDASVRELKGAGRPLNAEADRAAVLAALQSVDFVCIFPEREATRFLTLAQPDVYVKGGDYTIDTINQQERRLVENAGGKIVIIPIVPGKSTTALVAKINAG